MVSVTDVSCQHRLIDLCKATMLLFKEFRVASESGQSDLFALFVYPDQKKIILDVAFHKAGILTFKYMRIILLRYATGFLQKGQNPHQVLDSLRFVLISFQVFFELACIFENPHSCDL